MANAKSISLNTTGGQQGLRRRSVGSLEINDASGKRKTIALEDLNAVDRDLVEKFGYKPVLKREFGYWSTFSFAFAISGVFPTVSFTFYYPLVAGGAASIVWCWFISGAGCMCIACSVAELVSAYPTAGGVYFTVSRLVPPKWVPAVSWIVGWLNLLGQIAGNAGGYYGGAQILLAAVAISTDYQYTPTKDQTVGVMAALTVLGGLANSLSTYWMEKMTRTYVIFHFSVFIACMITLLVKTKDKHSASYAFTDVQTRTGWTPEGWSFLFGFLAVSFCMTDYDATAHITEEMIEPEIKAPWAIFFGLLCTYVFGWLFEVVLAFCMGDPAEILASPIGQPVVQIFYNSMGKNVALFFTCCAFVVLQFGCWTAQQSISRTIFAFSRDRLVPGSRIWTRINRFTGTPLYAVWIGIFWCIAINLIALGSYIAIAGVFNATAIALDWSYCIPIFCKLVFGRFEPGPWHLGKASKFINAYACAWTVFASVIFLMPVTVPVKADNMNYAVAFLGGILIVATIWWYISGRKWYKGPLKEAEIRTDDITSPNGNYEALQEKR